MNDNQRKKDYEISANEFWRWILAGEKMLQASEILSVEYAEGIKLMREQKCGKAPLGMEMLEPILYLRAISLELFLKGLYVKSDKPCTGSTGHLAPALKTHNLSCLYKKVFSSLSKERKDVLDKLTDAIHFWGRYPIPRTHKGWRKNIEGYTGLQPLYTWSDIDDKLCSQMIDEISREMASLSKGQQPPEWFKVPRLMIKSSLTIC